MIAKAAVLPKVASVPYALLLAAALAWPSLAAAQSTAAADLTGKLPDGQEWQITVPASWNGIVINDLDRVTSPGRAEFFLSHGYAYTGTRRHADRGSRWNPQAESDNMARVLDIFEGEFGRPRVAVQFGCSGGGSTALSVAEDHPDRFDGVIAMHASSPVTLANMRLDLTFALKALLDPSNELPLIVDPTSSASAEEAWARVLEAAQATAQGRARMALAGVLAQYPPWGSAGATPPVPKLVLGDVSSAEAALMRVVVDGANRALTSRPQWDGPAGLMSWNTGVDYAQFYGRADVNQRKLVDALYAKAGLNVQSDLGRINAAPRVAASSDAVDYWRSRTHTGRIGIPMLQISNIGDANTPAANMSSYQASVRQAGRTPLYHQSFIGAAGHCTFNTTEMGAAVMTLVHRIESGAWGDFASPAAMNAAGQSLKLDEPRFTEIGPNRGFALPGRLNRAFFPDSPGPVSTSNKLYN